MTRDYTGKFGGKTSGGELVVDPPAKTGLPMSVLSQVPKCEAPGAPGFSGCASLPGAQSEAPGHPRCSGNRHLILEVTSFSRFEAGTEVTPVVRRAAFAAIAS